MRFVGHTSRFGGVADESRVVYFGRNNVAHHIGNDKSATEKETDK